MAVKSLDTLIKLQKTYVNEQLEQVARLQDMLDQINAKMAQLSLTKAREQAAAKSDEARATYGAYLKSMILQTRALDKERKAAAMAVKIAQDKLAELFEEQKRYEIAREQRLQEEAKAARRRETLELDEIGGVMRKRGD